MVKRKEIGYIDWDDIVKAKEASLKVIDANRRNIEVGEIVEQLVLDKALIERDKYLKPSDNTMEEEEEKKDEEENKEEEKKDEPSSNA